MDDLTGDDFFLTSLADGVLELVLACGVVEVGSGGCGSGICGVSKCTREYVVSMERLYEHGVMYC